MPRAALACLACLACLMLSAAAIAAPAEEEGEVRLWVSATYTGVHTWESKERGAGPEASTTTKRRQDKLVLRLCGTSTWRLKDWMPVALTDNCQVTADGGGRFVEIERGTGACNKHRGAPFTASDVGAWTYTVPGKPESLIPGLSPAGTVTVAPGIWMLGLNTYPNCAHLAPRGSWSQRYAGCCERRGETYAIDAENEPPGQARALFLATDAFTETIGHGSDQGNAQGTWDTAKKGFFVSGHVRNQGGERNTKLGEPPTADPTASYFTGTESGYWTADIFYTISFTMKPPPVECALEPAGDYAGWLPAGGADEKTLGNRLGVTARLQVKGQPDKEPLQKARFRFEFAERSSEPGVALNLPLQGAAGTPDLRLLEGAGLNVTDDGRVAETASGTLRSASAEVGCYDYGAYGKLRVTATLDDGSVVYGHLAGQPGKEELLIPRDSDGNHVADAWNAGTEAGSWDGETEPALDGTAGDGLTFYEEYRGLVHQGAIRRLHPRQKDLAIVNEMGASAAAGLRLFEGASGLAVTELSAGELSDDRVVNVNSATAGGAPQHALRLVSEALPEGIIGMAYPDRVKTCPAECERTAINSNLSFLPAQAREALLAGGVAHELGHSLGAQHHGDSGPGTTYENLTITDVNARIYDTAGRPIETRPYTLAGLIETKANGGEASGAQDCVMRNSSYFQWVKRVDRMGVANYYAVPPTPPGTAFCQGTAGTGLNAPGNTPLSYFGGAATDRGACATHLRVTDR